MAVNSSRTFPDGVSLAPSRRPKNLLASLGSRRTALLARFASQRVSPSLPPAAARASGAMFTPPGSPERKHSWGAVKLGQVFLLPGAKPDAPLTPARVVLESKRRVQVRAPRRPAPHPCAGDCLSAFGAPRARATRPHRPLRASAAPTGPGRPPRAGILRALAQRARETAESLASAHGARHRALRPRPRAPLSAAAATDRGQHRPPGVGAAQRRAAAAAPEVRWREAVTLLAAGTHRVRSAPALARRVSAPHRARAARPAAPLRRRAAHSGVGAPQRRRGPLHAA